MGIPGSTWKPVPAGKKFKYKCMLLNGLENFVDPAIVPLSERTDLPPEAKALLFTIDNLPTKGGGLQSSRWYSPPSSPTTPPKSVATSISSSLNPTAKGFIPAKALQCASSPKSDTGSTSSLDPAAKAFTPAKMSRVTEASAPHMPASSQGLISSRWAQPASKPSTIKTAANVELDPKIPVKAQDIPVHLRGYYIAPHLRPAGLKAVPGEPLLPYIEPHQRVGILPEVIPNDSEYQIPLSKTSHLINGEHSTPKSAYSTAPTYQAPPTSPVIGSENSSKGDAKTRVPYLASTFEEFIGRKRDVPSVKKAPSTPLASTKSVIRKEIHLPPDCYSIKLAPDRNAPKLQPKVQKKQDVTPGAPWPVQEAHTMSSGKESEITASEQINKGQQLDLVEPKVYSTAEMPLFNTRVQQTDLEFVKDIQEIILFEVMNPQPGILDLTRDALIRVTDVAPKDSARYGVEDFVSDDGIKAPLASDEVSSPNNAGADVGDSRGYLAMPDDTLQQPDGTWMPVPCDWEEDRSKFENGFILQYIAMWAKTVPPVTGKVDTDCDEFKSGLSPLSLLRFEEPVTQPLCYPDVEQSDDRVKQLVQTAEIDSRTFANRILKKQRMRERQAQIAVQQQFYIEEDIIVNPNIPKIDIYLRPAQMKDISGITSIYNHYVLNSIIPEDQHPVSEQNMDNLLKDVQEQGLPFIVAIKGRVPPDGSTNSAEHVLGFAHIDFLNYGNGGTHKGLSRFTGVIQLYVEPNHTRKGVGRSLMDRILVCSSFTHASKEGYNWISPDAREAAVYGQQGGAHKFHQLLIHRPIEVKEDPDHEWFKQWLHGKFFIEEVARLKSVARSSSRGTAARMLDVLIFQFEAALAGGFDITH